MRLAVTVLLAFCIAILNGVAGSHCNGQICTPAVGNLLTGREMLMTASSTCGVEAPTKYCDFLKTREGERSCSVCDTRKETEDDAQLNHRIAYVSDQEENNLALELRAFWLGVQGRRNESLALSKILSEKRNKGRTWWQSENGERKVTLQFDFQGKFEVSGINMVFKSTRPSAMMIEKSKDYGRSWEPWHYIAKNCNHTFPGVATKHVTIAKEWKPVCESGDTSIIPFTEGEVLFYPAQRLHGIGTKFGDIAEIMSATNIRVTFLRFNVPLGLWRDKSIQYYALYNIGITGRCACNGHAENCLPRSKEDNEIDLPFGMVHPACECEHNTAGENCEICKPGYYRNPGKSVQEVDTCIPCQCDPLSAMDNECHHETGQCPCKSGFVGAKCDQIVQN